MESKTRSRTKPFVDLLEKHQTKEAFSKLARLRDLSRHEFGEITSALAGQHVIGRDETPELALVRHGIPVVYVNLVEFYGHELQDTVRQFIEHIRIHTPLARFPQRVVDEHDFVPLDRSAMFAVRCHEEKYDSIGMARAQFVDVTSRTRYHSDRDVIESMMFTLFPNLDGHSWMRVECTADVKIQKVGVREWYMSLISTPYLVVTNS